ncbi:unnamed protein product, partial [Meganyctiphanes norvegica]
MPPCGNAHNDLSQERVPGTSFLRFERNSEEVEHKIACITEILFCMIYIFFLLGWIGPSQKKYWIPCAVGDPSLLLHGRDTEGRVCGRHPGLENKTNLFFFDLTQCGIVSIFTGCITEQVCVESCPDDKWFFSNNNTQSDVDKLICKMNTNLNNSIDDLVRDGQCASYYVPSEEIAGRCFPKNLDSHVLDIFNSHKELYLTNPNGGIIDLEHEFNRLQLLIQNMKHLFRYALLQQVLENVALDVLVLWKEILLGFAAAMLVSFIYIMMLRIIAAVIIYFSIVAFMVIAGYGCYYTMSKYVALKGMEKNMTVIIKSLSLSTEENVKTGFTYLGEQETTWLVLFIIIITALVVVVLILIFLRKRISIAIALIGQASKVVASMTSSLFFPIIPFILHLVFFAFFCYTALLLESSRNRVESSRNITLCHDSIGFNSTSSQETHCDTSRNNTLCPDDNGFNSTSSQETHCDKSNCSGIECHIETHKLDPYISYLQFYNLFGLFWSVFFTSAFGEMVLAGAFASWYWCFDKSKDVPTFTIIHSLGRTLRYHVGTLAFGSLIIAVVRMFRTIMEYIDYKVRQHTDSKIAKILMWCCRCCLWCLEKFLKYINRNAYVYCAIYGKNFCKSARKAVSLIFRNAARAVVLDKVTDFLLFIGKMVICSGMAAASFLYFNGDLKNINPYSSAMNYYQTPVVVITIGTYFISSSFFSVYDMAVDTMFLCFLEDCERNDGSSEKPYYMSKDLRKILDKKNETQDTELDKFK